MSAMAFLQSIFGRSNKDSKPAARPLVTLAFAQSLDAKIAGKDGKQLILSGNASMVMTHWMRTMHDAILIGIGTALNDNPQLNTRHLPARQPDPARGHNNPYDLPRPIIIDSQLRLQPNCKLLNNYCASTGRRPWVMCGERPSHLSSSEWDGRTKELEAAGARIIQVESSQGGRLSLAAVLHKLQDLEIRSVMVEGGAHIIASFFEEDATHPGGVIDTIIVTVAPTFVGPEGVGYDVPLVESRRFAHAESIALGKDSIMALVSERHS